MRSLTILIVCANLLAVSSQGNTTNETSRNETSNHTLYLGVFLSMDTEDPSQESIGFLPALDLAIETVNNHSEVLKNLDGVSYTLEVVKSDSKCEASTSLQGFIHQIFNEPTKIMLIGASCSVSTEPLAELSPYWSLVQISPSASSPRLSSTSPFSRFLRTVSSDREIDYGISRTMRRFGWSRIALLTQSENIFTFFAAALRDHFEKERGDLKIITEISFNTDGDVEQAVAQLQRTAARVVFVNMYSPGAIRVVCEAHRRGMTHPTYAWMFFNWYSNDWWNVSNSSSCTDDMRKSFLDYSLVFDHYPRINDSDKNETNIAGMTYEQYEHEYYKRLQNDYPHYRTDLFNDSVYTFDAVWAAALALHNASKVLENDLTLMNFSYNSENTSRDIYEAALSTSFFGLSVKVNFDSETGDRIGKVRLLQYRYTGNLSKVQFAEISSDKRLVFLQGLSVGTVYPNGMAVDEEHTYIDTPLFATYTVLSVIGIVFSCVMLIFNLWYREQPYVQLSNPYLNILIVIGAIMFYVVVILFGVDENTASFDTVDSLCHTRIWLCAFAFTLLCGTIIAKTYKIYHIFRHTKPNSTPAVDLIYLFLIVGVLLGVDFIFLVVVTSFDNTRLNRREKELGTDDDDGSLPEIVGVCDAEHSVEWLSVLFAYKGFILLAGLFLAVETRKVKLASLNESRFIAMSVYGAVIVSIALTPIGFLLENFPNAQYAILGIMILISVTIILGLVFLSKMYKVYRDPDGKSIRDEIKSESNMSTIKPTDSTDYNDNAYRNKIEMLNMEVIQLRDEIAQLKRQNSATDLDVPISDTNGSTVSAKYEVSISDANGSTVL
ncbi:gamma-aminobutyric acid type B receptor subunit 2-like isoform X2 [Dysidea avara]|uniref:gamma-aminobutyric acid type B receptor subunit 2-like isoform X2 n=1 Tax=Dysidea avara TaxID=196820 RepID=UPI0033284616